MILYIKNLLIILGITNLQAAVALAQTVKDK